MSRFLAYASTIGTFLIIALTYQACSRAGQGNLNDGSSSLASSSSLDAKSQALNVLDKNCVACHNSSNLSGTGLSYADDLNRLAVSPYVVPGNPQASSLYQEIQNGTMPPGTPLSAAEAGLIYDWIKSLGPASPSPTPSVTPTATPLKTPTPTPTPSATPNTATFSYIYANILQPKCVSCHGSAGGYSYASYADTMKSVVANNANNSPLYSSVYNGRMPTSTKLSTQEIQIIYNWIQAGALNN